MATNRFTQQLMLQLLVDSSKLNSGLKKAGGDAKKASKEMDKFRDSARTAFQFAGSVGLGTGVIVGLKKTVTAYGEFINQMQTASAVFGDSLGIITTAMEDSVEAVGLGETAYLKATSYIAGLGKAAGLSGTDVADFSQDIVALGADLASAFNTDVEQAIGAIQSGFSGSSVEPLRRYNVVINDTALKQEYLAITGEKVTGVLTQQQRAAAFISLLYKKSADFQGQWNRESQQFQGTLIRLRGTIDNASNSIGKGFEPAITSAMNSMIPLIKGFTTLNDASGGLIGTLGGIAALLFAGRSAMAVFGVSTDKAAASLKRFKLARLASESGLSAIAMGGLAAGVAAFAVNSAIAAKKQKDLNEAMDRFVQGGDDYTAAADDLATIMGDLVFNNQGFIDSLSFWNNPPAVNGIEDIGAAFKELATQAPAVAGSMIEAAEAGGELGGIFGSVGIGAVDLRRWLAELAVEQEEVADGTEIVNNILNAQEKALEDAADAAKEAADAFKGYSDGLDTIAESADDANDALNGLADGAIDRLSSIGDADLERLKITQAQAEANALWARGIEDGQTATEYSIELLEAQAGLYDQIGSALETAIEEQELAAGAPLIGEDRIDFMLGWIEQLKRESPELATALDQMIADITGQDVDLLITASGEEAVRAKIEAMIGEGSASEVIIGMALDRTALERGDIETVLAGVDAEKRVEILLDAASIAAEKGKLEDEDFVADLTLQLLTDEAKDSVDAFVVDSITEADWIGRVQANTDELESEIQSVRIREGNNPIVIPVVMGKAPPRGGGSGGSDVPISATSSQPIMQNTTFNITQPVGSDSDTVVAAVQRWQRRHGTIGAPVA